MTGAPSLAPLILLAGGKSTRAGEPKGLIDYRGRPWVEVQVEAFRALGGKDVFLILGYDAQAYESVSLPDLRKRINPDPEHGPFTSIQTGAGEVLKEGFPSAFVLPIDVPVPSREVWLSLALQLEPGVRICQPVINEEGKERGGHPVLLAGDELKHLLSMEASGRLDLRIHELGPREIRRVLVSDGRIRLNLNTPESWKRFTG